MKKNLNIFVFAIALLMTQSCGSKPENVSEQPIATETASEEGQSEKSVVLTVSERKAKLERERMDREEKRKIEYEKLAQITPTYTDKSGKIVFYKVEVSPSFNGGDKAMIQYLRDNLEFPAEAEEKGVEGTVFVDFIIDEKGAVREVDVTEATSEDVDQLFRNEAIRVVSSMPSWVPGRQNGKAVDVKFSLPITFEMD